MLLELERSIKCRTVEDAKCKINFLIRQNRRLGLILFDEDRLEDKSQLLDACCRDVIAEAGQVLSFSGDDFESDLLPKRFLAALDTPAKQAFRLLLNRCRSIESVSAQSPFCDIAVLWQRLFDYLIEDEMPRRQTLCVIDRLDHAGTNAHNALTRLIRFHQTNRVPRTFLLTVSKQNIDWIPPNLHDLVELTIEL